MPVRHCLVLPHGFSLIDEISGSEKELFSDARNSIRNIVHKYQLADCKHWLVFTPHGVRVKDQMFNYCNESFKVNLQQEGFIYQKEYRSSDLIQSVVQKECFRDFMKNLVYGAKSGIYGVSPLDWGAAIPLYFMNHEISIGVIAMDRYNLNIKLLEDLGGLLNREFDNLSEDVGIILSSDFGHCHTEKGIGGYHPASKLLDEVLMDALSTMDFTSFDNLPMEIVEEGKSDAIGQMQILKGLLNGNAYNKVAVDYYVPTYFGLPIAYYRRRNG